LWGLFKVNPWVALAISTAAYLLVRALALRTETLIKVVQGEDTEALRRLLTRKWSEEALAFGLRTAAASGRIDHMRLLLEAGAPVNRQTGRKGLLVRTALMEAALKGQPVAVTVLLDRGADPNALVDSSGHRSSALQFACLGGHIGCVGALLRAGAGANVTNAEGETPLMYAAACGHLAAIRLLLQEGVDLNAKSRKGQGALDWVRATMSGWGQRDVLLRAGAKVDEPGLKETEAFLEASGATAKKLPEP
jgi:hypothetical protein